MTNYEKVEKTLNELRATEPSLKVSRNVILEVAKRNGIYRYGCRKWFFKSGYRLDRGTYDLSSALQDFSQSVKVVKKKTVEKTAVSAPVEEPVMNLSQGVSSVSDNEIYIPRKHPSYVKWGHAASLEKILESNHFFPVYISGLSGNGKTFMVEQAAAKAKREYVRVQISPETDEDDLIGGFRLINGETIFQKGPVIKAMERGAILLLDEIDRGTNKIMCLQGVLEGKPVLLKKTGELIEPKLGFNVIATANTKGRGSDDGRYSAATIIDDAFLERFVAALDQPYPASTVEKKIVVKHMDEYEVNDEEFAEKLVSWSSIIRKTYEEEGVDEIISTRRLCHIVKSYSIFGDKMNAIEMCITRFDEETRTAFLDLYKMVDEGIKEETPLTEEVKEQEDEVPF